MTKTPVPVEVSKALKEYQALAKKTSPEGRKLRRFIRKSGFSVTMKLDNNTKGKAKPVTVPEEVIA